jgi:hypothetical protein
LRVGLERAAMHDALVEALVKIFGEVVVADDDQ